MSLETDVSPPPLKRRRISPSGKFDLPSKPSSALPSTSSDKSSILRIYSWNINGIKRFLPSTDKHITDYFASTRARRSPSAICSPTLRTLLQSLNYPQVILLQEVKIAAQDGSCIRDVRSAVNQSMSSDDLGPHYDAYFCLPRAYPDGTKTRRKQGVYGVCTLIRRDVLVKAVKEVDWDSEGRILCTELECDIGTTKRLVVVINFYAVNGTAYPYYEAQSDKHIPRHERKRQVHSLLAAEISRYMAQDYDVVFAGDMNVALTPLDAEKGLRMFHEHVESRLDFARKFLQGRKDNSLQMIDTFRLIRGQERKYSYRGSVGGDRIDLILVSERLAEAVVRADIIERGWMGDLSDHVPVVVELSLESKREVLHVSNTCVGEIQDTVV